MTLNDHEPRKILVLGAGELGMAVLRGLASRRPEFPGTEISVLLRPSSHDGAREEDLRELRVATVLGDLAEQTTEELADIFRPFDAVISCSGFAGGPGTQVKITSAVLQAQVKRYIPWQFGVDYDAIGYGSGQDAWDEQLDVRKMLREQSHTRWLIVSTGMFTSYLFEPSFGVVDFENSIVHALADWDHQLTVTTPEDIGRLTADIFFSRPEVAGVVYIAGDTVSYRELKKQVEALLGRPFRAELLTLERLQTFVHENPNDTAGKYRLAFARSTGVAWDKSRTFNAQRGLPVTTVREWLET